MRLLIFDHSLRATEWSFLQSLRISVCCKHKRIGKTKSYLSTKMCYVGWQLGSRFYSAASFKAREIKAREEILVQGRILVQSSPWFNVAVQRAQRNLMKQRYLVVTRCKLTLCYWCSLEAREESKEAQADDAGGPYMGGKLHADLWGEKVVWDRKGSKWLESLESHTFQEASQGLPLLYVFLMPYLQGSPALSEGPSSPARRPFSYL